MPCTKALHLGVIWFRSLSCLLRPFVCQAVSEEGSDPARLEIMARGLFSGIMTPGEVVSALLGLRMRCSFCLASLKRAFR